MLSIQVYRIWDVKVYSKEMGSNISAKPADPELMRVLTFHTTRRHTPETRKVEAKGREIRKFHLRTT
jgi:hypothetical protein